MKKLFIAGAMLLAAISPVLAPAMAAEFKQGDITIVDPWARATPGKAPNGGAFLMIKSAGAGDKLIGVESKVAKRTELHNHINDNGVMKMRQVAAIEVPAGGMAMLKPGGYHVMLMKLHQGLKEGDRFTLTLLFEKAGAVEVQVEVKAVGAMGSGAMHRHGQNDGHGKMKMNK
jgi:copper(I)-binding protein